MGAVYFYHLTDSTLEAALPQLIERARAAGWKVAVRGPDAGILDRLDTALWSGPEDGFPAHGRAGGPHDALQPVLLCDPSQTLANNAQCLMTVEGVDVSQDDVAGHERVCILFDGQNGDAVATARTQWKSLTDAGCAAQYWAQDGGRWTKKAETGA